MIPSSNLTRALRLGQVDIPNRVFLAPMSGVTDEPFRNRAVRHGAGLVVSEMIASGELLRGRTNSTRRMRRPDVPVHVVQLAGREAAAMREAARIAAGEGADIIDINMGCPAKKVTGGYCGSALMRDPELAESLIEAVTAAVNVPVTVKMRLGWDDASINAPELARRAEGAGVSMVTVHGRTRCQFYKGRADWHAVRSVREAVAVPLVVNGDIASLADAVTAVELSRADAVMVGREAYGQPWLPGAIVAAVGGTTPLGCASEPEGLADYVVAHYEDMLALYGRESGLRHARKHLGWYLDRHAPAAPPALCATVMTSVEPNAVIEALRVALDHVPSLRQAA